MLHKALWGKGKGERCWMRGSSSSVLGSAPIDTFADLHKGRNRSTSRLWVTQEANAGTDFRIAQKPSGWVRLVEPDPVLVASLVSRQQIY